MKKSKIKFLSLIFIFIPTGFIFGQEMKITEIFYDAPGADSGREWVEIYVEEGENIDFTTWRFFENETNHKISFISGQQNVSAGDCLVLVDNSEKFLLDFPDFSGNLFDSAFSLKNADGETLKILKPVDSDYLTTDEVFYIPVEDINSEEWYSLSLINGVFKKSSPTPGVCEGESPPTEINNTTNETNTGTINDSSDGVDFASFIPKISLKIKGTGTIFSVGAPMKLSGEVFGEKGSKIENARISWTFGDGYKGEGSVVSHSWNYPGEYLLVVNASSGESSDTIRQNITVKESKMAIEFETNKDDLQTRAIISNLNAFNIDISGWILKNEFGEFYFPEDTIILPNKKIILDDELVGFRILPVITGLFYPNGHVVKLDEIENKSEEKLEPVSVNKVVSVSNILPTEILTENVEMNDSSQDETISIEPSTITASPAGAPVFWPYFLGVFGLIGAGALVTYRNRDDTEESQNEGEKNAEIKGEAKRFKIVYDESDGK